MKYILYVIEEEKVETVLISFRFKNFKSFKDEQTFSMVAATADTTLKENTFDPKILPSHKTLLTSAAIFGPNASGKTNLLQALAFLESYVYKSDQQNIDGGTDLDPFLLDRESINEPSEFEINFIQNRVRYQYRVLLNSKKVLQEELTAYPKGIGQRWFARGLNSNSKPDFVSTDGTSWEFGPALKGEKKRLAVLTRENVLFLTQAAKLNHEQLSEVYKWFGEQLWTYNMVGPRKLTRMLHAMVIAKEEPDLNAQFKQLLGEADLGIEGFEIREEEIELRELPEELPEHFRTFLSVERNPAKQRGAKTLALYVQHATDDPEYKVSFTEEKESFGTLRLFEAGGLILNALKEGQILVLDELDSSLHPILLRNLVALFHNPETNRKGAQLIFNTHDTTLLDTAAFREPLFRRDQVWLVEKQRNGASNLYSLWDFDEKPRNSEALQKNYLAGRYGAIPVIDHLLTENVSNSVDDKEEVLIQN